MNINVMDFTVEVATGQITKMHQSGLVAGASWKDLADMLTTPAGLREGQRITKFHITQQGLQWTIE